MPLPRPRPKETQKEFIGRCMGDEVMTKEFKDASQRRAVCQAQWDKRKTAAAVPSQLTIHTMPGTLTIEAAEDEKQLPRFRMVAYSGGSMRIAGFSHPVVVDLAGLEIPSQNLPIRLDHERRQGVGHTSRVAVEDGKLVAEGLISRDTSWARDVARSGSNGFPWQASIGAAVLEAEFVAAGQRVTVNGRTFEGPLHVVRRAVLKEISFVDSGADTEASVKVAAQTEETETMEEKDVVTQEDEPKEPEKETAQEEAPKPDGDAPEPEGDEPPKPVEEPTQTPETVEASAADETDPVAEIRRRLAAETRRVEAIRKLCAGKHPDIEAKAIEAGWDTTRTELQVLRASRPEAPAVSLPQRPTSPQIFEAVALMAGGVQASRLEALYAEPVLEAADKLRGMGLQEFCELAAGQQLPRFRRDASGWLQAAFSTASLPGILSNIANKMLLEGYNYIEDAWRKICRIASVNDFKEHSRYRMTGAFTFEQVGPDGELKHGKVDEQKFGQRADTHGIMFALTRQMIINDDMGAFTDIPRQIGMGAAEAIADAVWGLWLSNPTQSDGKAFFHADHKNYLEGADTTLTVDGLTAAEVLFGEQTKPNGKPLGALARILLVPTALKVPAELLMTALQVNETTTANKPKPANNPHVGKFEVVSSVYLANTGFTGASSKAWYLLADPNRLPAIEVAFLNGVDRPTVEKTDADFNTLGIQFRGYIDFGVREQDYRGALKCKGEA